MEWKLRKRWRNDGQVLFHGCWLLVSDQTVGGFTVKSLHHQRDPHDYREITSSSASIPHVHNHTRAPGQTGYCRKRKTLQTQIQPQTLGHSLTDLQDWQWFVRFSCSYLCTPPECTSQFSSRLKALICHPVQSKFNASNYRGSASRQIWSEEAWQESLLRIRAF